MDQVCQEYGDLVVSKQLKPHTLADLAAAWSDAEDDSKLQELLRAAAEAAVPDAATVERFVVQRVREKFSPAGSSFS